MYTVVFPPLGLKNLTDNGGMTYKFTMPLTLKGGDKYGLIITKGIILVSQVL